MSTENAALGVHLQRVCMESQSTLLHPSRWRNGQEAYLYVVNTAGHNEAHVGEVLDITPVPDGDRTRHEPCVMATICVVGQQKCRINLLLYQDPHTLQWLTHGRARTLAFAVPLEKRALATPQEVPGVAPKAKEPTPEPEKYMGMTAADLLGIEKRPQVAKAAPAAPAAPVRKPPFYSGLLRISGRYLGIGFNDEIN